MANQQLVDYVKQQLQLGVSKEAIKGTLAQAGWPEADVNDALAAASPAGAAPAQPVFSAQPSSPATPAIAVSAKPAAPSSGPASSALSQFAQKPAAPASQPSPFVTKDIFQPKGLPAQAGEPTFQPKIQAMPAQAAAREAGGSSVKKYVLLAVWIVVILGLAGWSAYLFWQNRTLKEQASQSPGISASLEEVRAQVASLTGEKNSLTSQIDAANLERADLLLHLSFFVAPLGGATTTNLTVSGTIGGGGKSPYTLTTGRQVVLSVKNSSVSDVSKALQPLLGSVANIAGTYVPGTRDITVIAVNSVPVEAPPPLSPAPTSTPTSTPPAAP